MSFNQNLNTAGLNTITLVAPVAGSFFFDIKISCPQLVTDGLASQVVCTLTQNSTTVYTGHAGAEGAHVDLSCALGDTIVITFTSSAAVDQGLNVIKSTIAWGTGQ